MQLKFNRSSYEKGGFFGGSKTRYKLEAQIEPTDSERKFLDSANWNIQYLALERPIDKNRMYDFSSDLAVRRAEHYAVLGDYSSRQLLGGLTVENENPAVIQHAEKGIIAACKWVQNHCRVDEAFSSGREEIIDL